MNKKDRELIDAQLCLLDNAHYQVVQAYKRSYDNSFTRKNAQLKAHEWYTTVLNTIRSILLGDMYKND